MRAAAAGKSTIGIPKEVGKEYAMADSIRARKRKMDGGSNQPTGKTTQGKSKGKYGNFTDPTGKAHTHWKEGKSYAGSTSGGASIGGGAAGGAGGGGG